MLLLKLRKKHLERLLQERLFQIRIYKLSLYKMEIKHITKL